jgi:hypothetical protein
MRDLFDNQMEITDQLCDQGSPLFVETEAQSFFAPWMRLYPNATPKERQERFLEVTDPGRNKRGHVYSPAFEAEAFRLLNLK